MTAQTPHAGTHAHRGDPTAQTAQTAHPPVRGCGVACGVVAARTPSGLAAAVAAELLRLSLLAKLAVDLEDPRLARRAARYATRRPACSPVSTSRRTSTPTTTTRTSTCPRSPSSSSGCPAGSTSRSSQIPSDPTARTRASNRARPQDLKRPGVLVPDARIPAPPRGAKVAGRRLWRSVLRDFDLDEHELSLLRQAVHVADLCDDLSAAVDRDGTVLDGKLHPAMVELRMQRILLARLVVALRVPFGEQDGDGKQASNASGRTQHRGVRGVYALRGGAS